MKHRIKGVAIAALAAATGFAVPAESAKQTCGDRPYQDRTQVAGNAAGVVFVPKGDKFKIWDNVRDDDNVEVLFNYAGVDDFWKPVDQVDDGAQGTKKRNVSERFKEICFMITTDSDDYPDSPIVRYRTRP
jgi:hypothetical protein